MVSYSTSADLTIEVNDTDGWHSLILESTFSGPTKHGSTIIHSLLLNNESAWPITDLDRVSPPVPFCLSQGHFYSESNDDHVNANEIFNNSFIRIYFLIKNKKIVEECSSKFSWSDVALQWREEFAKRLFNPYKIGRAHV